MNQALRSAATLLVLLCALAVRADDAPLEDFHGTFADTVIQIELVEVGERLESINVSDEADSRMYLTLLQSFAVGQRVTYSVFDEADFRISFWGGGEAMAVVAAEAVDDPAGKGVRLTYADGTVVVIIA